MVQLYQRKVEIIGIVMIERIVIFLQWFVIECPSWHCEDKLCKIQFPKKKTSLHFVGIWRVLLTYVCVRSVESIGSQSRGFESHVCRMYMYV